MKRRRAKVKQPIAYDWKSSASVWGMAFPDERRIELDPRMDDRTLLEIAPHEVIHVIAPFLDEEAVTEIGRHIGDVLHRLGFRRHEGED